MHVLVHMDWSSGTLLPVLLAVVKPRMGEGHIITCTSDTRSCDVCHMIKQVRKVLSDVKILDKMQQVISRDFSDFFLMLINEGSL